MISTVYYDDRQKGMGTGLKGGGEVIPQKSLLFNAKRPAAIIVFKKHAKMSIKYMTIVCEYSNSSDPHAYSRA